MEKEKKSKEEKKGTKYHTMQDKTNGCALTPKAGKGKNRPR